MRACCRRCRGPRSAAAPDSRILLHEFRCPLERQSTNCFHLMHNRTALGRSRSITISRASSSQAARSSTLDDRDINAVLVTSVRPYDVEGLAAAIGVSTFLTRACRHRLSAVTVLHRNYAATISMRKHRRVDSALSDTAGSGRPSVNLHGGTVASARIMRTPSATPQSRLSASNRNCECGRSRSRK